MSHRIFSYIAADILNPIRCLLFFTMEARDFLIWLNHIWKLLKCQST